VLGNEYRLRGPASNPPHSVPLPAGVALNKAAGNPTFGAGEPETMESDWRPINDPENTLEVLWKPSAASSFNQLRTDETLSRR
jgi:hypothetical protein